jgi:hypothetical protein
VHQRALSRPILANDGMNFARPHVKLHLIQRSHAWERLADAAHGQQR